jgi:hypothetical protein|uniref:Peptidase S74 domain-containing protein n=1 Tax=viral metagenome TaxID=1070528 RepID=A0A6C0IM71_9ZZZZ
MFSNNRTSIKELYSAPQAISVSSDGKSVTFENKSVSIGDVTSQTEVEPDVKFNVVGKTKMDGDVKMSQNVFIGGAIEVTDENVKLKVEGNTTINGTINTNEIVIGSDYRLKTNIKPLDDSFVVDHLKPVEYNKNNCDKKEIGFIAHELQNVYPDFVTGVKDCEATQHVNYNNLIGILVNEIQMLKKRVNELESKI